MTEDELARLEADAGLTGAQELSALDVDLRMSEFESRLHEVEAANLRQNSTWYAKFQAMETELADVKQRVKHCESRRGEFPTALTNTKNELQASIDQLAKSCAVTKQQLSNSIEASYKKCGSRIDECSFQLLEGLAQNKETQIQHKRCDECDQLKSAVEEQEGRVSALERGMAEQKHRQEECAAECQRLVTELEALCEKQCIERIRAALTQSTESNARRIDELAAEQDALKLKLDKSDATHKQLAALQAKFKQLEQTLAEKPERSELSSLAQSVEKEAQAQQARISSAVEAAILKSKEVAKSTPTRFPQMRCLQVTGSLKDSPNNLNKCPGSHTKSAEKHRRPSVDGNGVVPRVKHTLM